LLRTVLRLLLPLLRLLLRTSLRQLDPEPPLCAMPHRFAKVLRESLFRPLMPASAAATAAALA
jgi:hypothetical protein